MRRICYTIWAWGRKLRHPRLTFGWHRKRIAQLERLLQEERDASMAQFKGMNSERNQLIYELQQTKNELGEYKRREEVRKRKRQHVRKVMK